ncbi:MAG: DUF5050 domain-containing protein [Lachnospiraceae bacterium]|nr:DUF5050 domain-containing protein [Lachnospiraceae bacterium]
MNLVYYNQQPETVETPAKTLETSQKEDLIPEYYPYDVGYAGIKAADVPHKYGNTPFANFDFGDMDRNICYVQETDTLYYVDYAWTDDDYCDPDNCLYSYKDGIRTLITNLPARYLNFWQGNLYFLSNSNISLFYNNLGLLTCGKLYKYEVATGEIELLLDEEIWDLNICDGYLYYCTSPNMEDYVLINAGDYCRMNLENGESEKTYLRPYFHGEYQLQVSPDPEKLFCVALELTNGTETVRLLDYGWYREKANYCIAEGKLWFVHNDEERNMAFSSMDLTTGDVITYQLSNINPDARKDFFSEDERIEVRSIVSLNGVLYVTLNSYLFTYDTELEEMIPVEGEFDVPIGTVFWGIENLYTDGTYIYGYADGRDSIVKFRKLEDGLFTGEAIPRS